uniref:FYVE-type domain-containing protein n=1 Tax=Oncorhynchus tshawytscha TaxID=74940 RepID=A0AAZ3RX62_ONCTS
MENHFQTEAFNLDKVLDDFEQKQDETDSPSLSDKWIQILAPPAHLLSPNCALALTPDLGPLPLKTPWRRTEGAGRRTEGSSRRPVSPPPQSKEDSVTEEKEMEESSLENGGGDSSVPSILNTRLQLVSVPFGGARPKQPVTLKLQIPWPLSGQDQNQLSPTVNTTAVCKNKNLENRAGDITMETGTVVAGGDPGGCVEVVNGELLNGSSSLGLVLESESSPDNDLQAGCHHQGALPRKQLSSLGDVAPVWVPDSKAPVCMKCEVRFTFTKRRHHCRACGKVFCAACCSLRSRLIYMDRKEARVCITCHSALLSGHSWEGMCGGSNQSPNPNDPAQYCSTIPPLQQIRSEGNNLLRSPPKHQGPRRRVRFADGILPNGEAAESPKLPASSPAPSQTLAVSQCSNKSFTSDLREPGSTLALSPAPASTVGSPVGSSISLIPEDGLPPILISTGVKGDYAVEERPSEMVLIQQLEEGGPDPLVFVLNANLLAMVKLVNYVNRKCWYVTSKGMHAVGQAEVVVLLQCLPDEKSIPKDLFSHFVQLYQEALTGNVLTHLGHSFFTQSFLGSREHGGFLYKWETPWAKMFPIRLMLRLGAEYRFYPCPLFSVRFRKPLFGEAGHTIMTLLVDFRNYQYTLPLVKGLVVDMEVKKTCIKIPSNRYNELMKAMNKSNEHVLAMGACFNELADSHLVCIQNDDGNYHTQAISIHHQPRKVTGACFFVFSGSLKASSGYLAKTSIVEDGVMVQITAETMDALRQALRDMKDFSITCGWADQEYSQEHVHIQWIDDDHNFFNKGVISPIDGKSMEFITSVRIFHGSEFKADGKVIRWTEVFFLQSEDQPNGLSDPADHSRLTENVARAFCMALCPHLKLLKEEGMAKLGLRVTLESDQVGYLAGSNGQPLLSHYLRDLDSTLIPVIHRGACQLSEGPVVMELVFYILEILS